MIFSVIPTGALANQAEVYLTYTKLKPESVSASDVIGGVNAVTGKYTGLELVNQVFPKFRLIPGLIGAPKFSELPEVAAVMVAKAHKQLLIFQAIQRELTFTRKLLNGKIATIIPTNT